MTHAYSACNAFGWLAARSLLPLVAAILLVPGPANAGAKMSMPHSATVDGLGRAQAHIPIEVPPGTAGMVPSISLSHSSGLDAGVSGVGWTLGVLPQTSTMRVGDAGITRESIVDTVGSAITRCPSNVANDGIMAGVQLDADDRFCLDGQRLVVQGSGTYGSDLTEYRTEVESFTKVISYGVAGTGPAWFRVWTKSGLILEYGNTGDSRIEAPGSSTARLWSINKVSDRSGNYYTATYTESGTTGEHVIDRIDYTGNAAASLAPYNSVRFVYETRPDISAEYVGTILVVRSKRLTAVQTFVDTSLVKDYRLTYAVSTVSGRSLVTGVTECDAAAACLPSIAFGYTPGGGGISAPGLTPANLGNLVSPRTVVSLTPGDFNGDGVQDVWVKDHLGYGRICYGPTFTPAQCGAPWLQSTVNLMVVDYNGDGISDLALHWPTGELIFCAGPSPAPTTGCVTAPNAANPYPNFLGYQFVAGDFNGDGLAELFGWNTQDPNQTWGMHCYIHLIIWGANCNGRAINGTAFAAQKGDFDGDGLTELLFSGTGSHRVCTGRSQLTQCSNVSHLANWRDDSKIVVADFTGDGKDDLIRLTTTGLEFCAGPGFITADNCTPVANAGAGDWKAAYQAVGGDFNSDGTGDLLLMATVGTWFCPGPNIASIVNCTQVNSLDWRNAATAVQDFNGDASADAMVASGTQFSLAIGAATPTDLLASVSDTAFSTATSFTYKPLTDSTVYTKGTGSTYPLQETRHPFWVASEVARPNGIGTSNIYSYKYEKARIAINGRRFLGYEIVKETDQALARETVTTRAQTYPHYNRVADVKVYVGGVLVRKLLRDMVTSQTFEGRPMPVVGGETDASYGLDGSWKSDKTSYGYDTYGNRRGVNLYVDENSTTHFRRNETLTMTNDAAQWLFGQLTTSDVVYNKVGSAQVRQTHTFTTVPGTLLVSQQIRDPNTASLRLVTDFARDAFGNVTSTTVSGTGIDTRTTSQTYDAKGRFALTTTNALGHVTTQAFDERFGAVTSSTDTNNLTTLWQIDGFGRPTLEIRPDATYTVWGYDYCCTFDQHTSSAYRVIALDSGSTQPTATAFDGLGRQVHAMKRSFADTQWIIEGNTWFDAGGRVVRKYLPYELGTASPPYAARAYDTLGRLATETGSNAAVTTYSYSAQPNAGPITTTIVNANSQTTKHVRNVTGQLIEVVDALTKSTTYEYSPHGHLARTTDALGNQIVSTYNTWGWLTARTDPDLGAWTYAHDRLGKMVTQTDAKSQVTSFTYDKLGRKTGRSEPSMTATWTWDTALKGIGQLASSTTNAGVTNLYAYDAFGRPSVRTANIDSVPYAMSYGYDAQGRQNLVTYPSGFAVKRVFNNVGYLGEVRDNATNALFWRAVARSPAGVTDEDYGNGTGVVRTFDPLTNRVTQIGTIRDSDSSVQQNFTFGYDPIGNTTSRAETTQGVAEGYAYDSLNRLASVSGPTPKSYT